jgi:hypothetical protein
MLRHEQEWEDMLLDRGQPEPEGPEEEEPDWAPLCRCETCSPDNITCVSKD